MRTKYLFSPEFQRQIWLNFTPFKLMMVPIALVATYVYFRVIVKPDWQWMPDKDFQQLLLFPYGVIICIFGQYAAGEALQDEAKYNTWDFQRVSSISPAQLAFGKLFGVTSYSWFLALLMIGLIWVMGGYTISPEVALSLIITTLVGLIGQAFTFLCGLSMLSPQQSRYNMSRWSSGGVMPFIIGCFVTLSLIYVLLTLQLTVRPFVRHKNYLEDGSGELLWYGDFLSVNLIVIGSLCFVLVWLWIACYRTVRVQLMYRETPTVWAVFIPVCLAWYGGFFQEMYDRSYSCALLLAQMTFVIMIAEAGNIQKYKRLSAALHAVNLRSALENVPKWLIILPWLALFYINNAVGVGQIEYSARLAALSAFILIILRDGLIVHLLHWYDHRRALYRQVIYFTLVYIISPYLAFSVRDPYYAMDYVARGLYSFVNPLDMGSFRKENSMFLSYFYPCGAATASGGLSVLVVEAIFAAILFLVAIEYKKRKTGKTT